MSGSSKKIRGLTVKLLEDNRVEKPPVPVEKIIKRKGIKIHEQQLESSIAGFALRANGQEAIGVNIDHHDNRKRFTLAHELGHLLLHDQTGVHIDRGFSFRMRSDISSQGTSWDEVEANRFAAELLMPEHFLEKDLEAIGLDHFDPYDEDRLARLAERYKVSEQALLIRLTTLGIILP